MPQGLHHRIWQGSELKGAYLGGGWGIAAELSREPWLVLDELGAERDNASYREALIDLLNRRMGKWTVITTNLSEREIEQLYSSRVTSRMIRDGNVHVRVTAPDFFTR